MKLNNKISIVVIIILLVFQSCTFLNSNSKIKIINQELIYDSLYNKTKKFKVNLYTTLKFEDKNFTTKKHGSFLVVIGKDTFPLIHEANFTKEKTINNEIKIKYISYINFQSNEYENDSLTKVILNSSKIIDSQAGAIKKDVSYKFKALIRFHKIKKDGRIEM